MNRRRFSVVNLCLSVLVVGLLLFPFTCEPYPGINFDNQRDSEVKIFAAHVRDDGSIDGFVKQGIVPAHTTKIIHITFLGPEWVNRIQASSSCDNPFARRSSLTFSSNCFRIVFIHFTRMVT